MLVNLLEVAIGVEKIVSTELQHSQTAGISQRTNYFDELNCNILIVLWVFYDLIVYPLLVLQLAQEFDVKLHNLRPQSPILSLPQLLYQLTHNLVSILFILDGHQP